MLNIVQAVIENAEDEGATELARDGLRDEVGGIEASEQPERDQNEGHVGFPLGTVNSRRQSWPPSQPGSACGRPNRCLASPLGGPHAPFWVTSSFW
jgi:hypothetical protein